MPITHRSSIALALVVLALAWTAPVALAVECTEGFQDTRPGTAQALVLEVGRSILLRFQNMTRVVVVNPEVADVTVASANELLVIATANSVHDQVHTMMYVWDKCGIHKFAVTVVGMKQAERIAMDLRRSLGPNMNVEVVSDTLVVVEGEVADDEAADNLKTLLEAAATDDVKVVGMISTAEDSSSPAARTGAALSQILGPGLRITAWGEDVLVVEGEMASEAEATRARQAVAAVSEGLRVVDMITVRGQDLAAQAPVAQIQRLLGDEFTVSQLRGNLIAVDGVVGSDAELQRITRLLDAYQDQTQVINLVQVVPPKADLAAAQRALQAALGESMSVRVLGDEALLIEGSVASEAAREQLGQVLALFEGRVPMVNLVTVVEPERRRVLVAVKVIELNKGDDGDLGIDWGQYSGTPYDDAAYRPQPFLFGQVPGVDGWPELYRFASQVHALISKRKARLLAEPNLLVNDGEQAEMLIGGEIPVPISEAAAGGFASIHVEWKPFGVNLVISPRISPQGDRVLLEVSPEVSSLDFANGVSIGGLTIPALRTRRTTTIVTVMDGGVLAIGGLISAEQSKAVDKIPILGDLPIIGQLFRHDSFRNDRSELIILVFPQILDENGQPVRPVPVPEGLEGTDILNFGSRAVGELEIDN